MTGAPPDGTAATLTIDLGALVANWRLLGARAPRAEAGAVIKADGYGLGIEPVARALARAGCATFFVAHAGEGVRVRAVAPGATIYVLNGLPPHAAPVFAQHRLSPVLGSHEELEEWAHFRAGHSVRPAALHVDTAMNRLGLWAGEGVTVARERTSLIDAAGIGLLMTHFASSEIATDPANRRQIESFSAIVEAFPGLPASILNSSGHFLEDCPPYQLTRPGYALYGGNPVPGRPNPMRPVVGLTAPIIQVRTVESGTDVGYNGRWTAPSRRRLATIHLGYADGYPRNAYGGPGHPGGRALVGGVPCPFVGTVSMDLIIIDVTEAPAADAARGAPVTLIGGPLDLETVGAGARTVGYEILTSLGRRYERVHVGW